MCGIELAPPTTLEAPISYGRHVANELYERGHFTRPIGDTLQLVPPLSSSIADARDFAHALADALAA